SLTPEPHPDAVCRSCSGGVWRPEGVPPRLEAVCFSSWQRLARVFSVSAVWNCRSPAEPALEGASATEGLGMTDHTASDKLVKLKSCTLMAGMTTSPPASVPATRSARPSPSRLLSMKSGDSLKRKFFTAFDSLP